jgi:tRNA threonylcarbamoyladenosine biosynthesis protein TsaE
MPYRPRELTIDHPDGLDAVMRDVASALGDRRKIALYGEMGAGKTTFVKAFCRYLGVLTPTDSPTFSLINQYRYTDSTGKAAVVYHLDLYRLNTAEEAFDIGIEEVLYDENYCFIEWPQVAEALLPDTLAKIKIDITNGNLSSTTRHTAN